MLSIFVFSQYPFLPNEIFEVMKIVCVLPLVMLLSCGPKYETRYYKALSLDKKDTAFLKLVTSDGGFYGDYQIRYYDKTKDEGAVTGNMKGDTLIGKFSYLSRSNARVVAPIALLKSGKKLKLGTGQAGTYMGFHVYSNGSITFNDSLFQFQPVEPEESASLKSLGR